MKTRKKLIAVLKSLNYYLVFFLLIAFVITCCLTLFVTLLSRSLNIDFTEAQISTAAKATFINVVFISAMATVLDGLRRHFFINRPVQKITEAAEKITKGDFSVRIDPVYVGANDAHLNKIIDCFNKMAQELSGTETLRTDFIANVSHELKTPLAVMKNYGTLLQQPDLPEEKRMEYAKAVCESSSKQASLITNILKLNKLENQRLFPVAERYELSEQLRECLLGYEYVWEQKNIDISADIAEDVFVRADSELLSLVWNNLLSNAFKFTPEGGSVALSLKSDEKYITVSISDTGCGIPPEVGKHIFEKFYQGDTSHSAQGNGLGLALVKRVVDIMKGGISVESEVGKGSTFTVRLSREDV